jgi:hypothetical protein
LRHVQWVRIDLTGDAPTAEVAGVGHRNPVRRTIALRTAQALSSAGVPTFVRRVRDDQPSVAEPGPASVARTA